MNLARRAGSTSARRAHIKLIKPGLRAHDVRSTSQLHRVNGDTIVHVVVYVTFAAVCLRLQ